MKFGKQIDIDDLENRADKSFVMQIESEINSLQVGFREQHAKLVREREILSDKLVEATRRNTELVTTVANYTESKLEIARELNRARVDATGDSKSADLAEKQERDKIASIVREQEREIFLLRNEITTLNRKDVQQPLPYLPAARSQTAPDRQSGTLLPSIAISSSRHQQRPKSNYQMNSKSAR